MRLTTLLFNQLRFNFEKHFIPNKNVKAYNMESLGHKGDKRFGYTEPFQLLDEEATTYIRKLTENQEFLRKTKFVTSFSPFVLRNCAVHDPFLNDIYTSDEAENYFSEIVGEEMRWLSNTWDASHMNVQEKTGLDTKIFDWHMDSQPLTLIINVSDMPENVVGGSTILRRYDDGSEIELKQPAPGYATIFRGSGVFHRGSAANYKRVIYVKTMEFKDVTILDKTDALFSTQYSDPVDLLSQHLQNKFDRLQKQVELIRDNPSKADRVVEVVQEEMKNNQVFAKYAFHIQAGQETVETLVDKKLIQNVY